MNNIKAGYTRVTDVLSPFTGFSKIPAWVLDKAGERGTAVHKMFEDMSTGKEVDEGDANEYASYYQSLCKWIPGKDFLFPMDRLYSEELKITGLIDGIYHENGKFILFDLKTSQHVGRTWQEQLGAYILLLGNIKIDRCEIVQINNKGEEPKIFTFNEDDFHWMQDSFLGCLEVYEKFFSETVEEIDTEKL